MSIGLANPADGWWSVCRATWGPFAVEWSDMRIAPVLMLAVLLLASPARAQQGAQELGAKLLQDASVKAALEAARADEPRTLAEQVEICEVEAPPFKETKRGELYARKFRELGLQN